MTQLQAYFEVLVAVARADGVIDPGESRIIEAALEGLAAPPDLADHVKGLLSTGDDYDLQSQIVRAASVLDATTLAETLRDAYVVAGADGEVDDSEIGVVRQVLSSRVADSSYHALLDEWAREAATLHTEGLALIVEALGSQ